MAKASTKPAPAIGTPVLIGARVGKISALDGPNVVVAFDDGATKTISQTFWGIGQTGNRATEAREMLGVLDAIRRGENPDVRAIIARGQATAKREDAIKAAAAEGRKAIDARMAKIEAERAKPDASTFYDGVQSQVDDMVKRGRRSVG